MLQATAMASAMRAERLTRGEARPEQPLPQAKAPVRPSDLLRAGDPERPTAVWAAPTGRLEQQPERGRLSVVGGPGRRGIVSGGKFHNRPGVAIPVLAMGESASAVLREEPVVEEPEPPLRSKNKPARLNSDREPKRAFSSKPGLINGRPAAPPPTKPRWRPVPMSEQARASDWWDTGLRNKQMAKNGSSHPLDEVDQELREVQRLFDLGETDSLVSDSEDSPLMPPIASTRGTSAALNPAFRDLRGGSDAQHESDDVIEVEDEILIVIDSSDEEEEEEVEAVTKPALPSVRAKRPRPDNDLPTGKRGLPHRVDRAFEEAVNRDIEERRRRNMRMDHAFEEAVKRDIEERRRRNMRMDQLGMTTSASWLALPDTRLQSLTSQQVAKLVLQVGQNPSSPPEAVLFLAADTSRKEVDARFRFFAKLLHPDKAGTTSEFVSAFNQVRVAVGSLRERFG
jgi:hypothetical protein